MYRKRKFTKMYETYANDIYRYLFVHVRDEDIAADLTADTFLRAWNNIDSFDFSQPRPWLYKIARNLLTDHWRKKSTLPLEEPENIAATQPSVEEELDKKLASERVHGAIGKLDEPMKSVVTMRFLLGYSARQTAESLELKENNIRIIQYRALKKMKEFLK